MKATLYKVLTRDTELGTIMQIRFWTFAPISGIFREYEILGIYEIELPDDIEMVDTTCTGEPTFWKGKKYLEYWTQDDKFYLREAGEKNAPVIELTPRKTN